jgi:hypothetical protein
MSIKNGDDAAILRYANDELRDPRLCGAYGLSAAPFAATARTRYGCRS